MLQSFRIPVRFQTFSLFALLLTFCCSAAAQTGGSFLCAATAKKSDVHPLSAATLYAVSDTSPSGFGFDFGTAPASFEKNACIGDQPFYFSLTEPDGNYQVTLVLGGPVASTTTVRAESRRLMVDQMSVPAKGSKQIVFNVNVRTKFIFPADGAPVPPGTKLPEVRLKPREIGVPNWDDKLTLEFTGDHPSIRSITIQPLHGVPTVYIAGDSTVVDQDKEPWAAWGQMLPVFFGPGVTIANHAESGETIRSFVEERRLAKVESTIRPGDYLLFQFAHNDQKPGPNYVPAATDFKDYLRRYIALARAHGATPILVTAMNRRNFDADGKIIQTLGDFPQAMREVAAEQKVALIDLNAMSKILFETMGDEGTTHAFVHYAANTFPGQTTEMKDDTHFNGYGAYELARAVVQSIRDQNLPLAPYLRPGIPPFDPAHPDPLSSWKLPPSPNVSTVTPYGR